LVYVKVCVVVYVGVCVLWCVEVCNVNPLGITWAALSLHVELKTTDQAFGIRLGKVVAVGVRFHGLQTCPVKFGFPGDGG
jgi:hypothetical protein